MADVKVLIGCARSGVMQRAFEARGHDAWECDIEPSYGSTNRHIRGNVLDVIEQDDWDLLCVMHPPCTVLCNSGVKHLYIGGRKANGRNEARWSELESASAFYFACKTKGRIPKRAIENPVMHGHAKNLVKRGHTQFVQPWWFGDPYFKATGFELIGLPELKPTNRLQPPKPGSDKHKTWSRVHRASPGPDRARIRSETFPGIAAACALYWGDEDT